MRNVAILVLLFTAFITACGGPEEQDTREQINEVTAAPQQPSEVSTTEALILTDTPASTVTPLPTDTLEPAPPATTLPDDLVKQIEQTYKALVLVQAAGEMLNETAIRIQAGELEGLESFGYLIAVGAIAKGVDESIAEMSPPDLLAAELEDAKAVNNEVRLVISRWLDKEIDSSQVVEEMEPLLVSIDDIVTKAEKILAEEFGRDPEELSEQRREAMESVSEIFDATPTPEPMGMSTSVPVDGGVIALNYVAEQESGGIIVQIGRVLVGNKGDVEATTGNNFEQAGEFADKDVVAELVFVITNNSDQTVDIYPDQGTVQVNSEQIELLDYAFSGASFGDDLGGEIFPGVTKIGGLWFGIKRSTLEDIDGMIIRFGGPHGADSFESLGPDFEIVVELSDRAYEPIPEELIP